MSATTLPAPGSAVRKLGLFIQWQLRRGSYAMPMFAILQLLVAAVVVTGYGLIAGEVDGEFALYLATGSATIALVMCGFVMAPQVVGQARTEGSYEWMLTLPMPRWVFLATDLIVWSLLALPGMLGGLVLAALRFDITFSPTWWIALGMLLVAVVATSIGYSVAVLTPERIMMLITQVLVFAVMLFTPITYPAERLPEWLRTLHEYLPFDAMGQVFRAGLASNEFTMPGRSWLVLAVWGVASLAAATWALSRRQ